MPQSMHRAPWRTASSSGNGSYTSRQSRSRTGTGRRAGSTRSYSKNPVGLPMTSVLLVSAASAARRGHDRRVHRHTLVDGASGGVEHPAVVAGHDLHEVVEGGPPRAEQSGRDGGV